MIAAVPSREDARDALLSRGNTLAELPSGARVGTSSLRRQALLRAARPDLEFLELRGNLDTRLRKLDEGQYDAIVLACAGLARMGWEDRITERIPVEVCVPAPGQGALALEARSDDEAARALLAPLHDPNTGVAVAAERAFQSVLNAGCTVPVGAHAIVEGDTLRLIAALADLEGHHVRRCEERGPWSEAEEIGVRAAQAILAADERE